MRLFRIFFPEYNPFKMAKMVLQIISFPRRNDQNKGFLAMIVKSREKSWGQKSRGTVPLRTLPILPYT